MNDKFRQSLIGLIWPGPIAGPFPVNLLRFVSIVLVFFLGAFSASLIIGVITSIISVFYFEILELTEGKRYVEDQLQRLPKKLHRAVENRSGFILLLLSLVTGVFALALSLRLLKYPKTLSETLLVTSSFVNSFLWTGIVWGSIVGILKNLFG